VINVLVTEFTTYEMTVDPTAPEWDWLLRYPDEEWPRLLRQSANETDGTLDKACDHRTATGAWREVDCDAGRATRSPETAARPLTS
jgi:hypothetical protein